MVGHVQRRDTGYTAQRMVIMELPSRRKSRRPEKRLMGVVRIYRRLV